MSNLSNMYIEFLESTLYNLKGEDEHLALSVKSNAKKIMKIKDNDINSIIASLKDGNSSINESIDNLTSDFSFADIMDACEVMVYEIIQFTNDNNKEVAKLLREATFWTMARAALGSQDIHEHLDEYKQLNALKVDYAKTGKLNKSVPKEKVILDLFKLVQTKLFKVLCLYSNNGWGNDTVFDPPKALSEWLSVDVDNILNEPNDDAVGGINEASENYFN